MTLGHLALLGGQLLLGLVGLGVGAAKVTHQEDQVEDFQRFGYPPWFRVATGIVEMSAGVALIAGLFWLPRLTAAGGLLLGGVLVGAVLTHVRTGDPTSKTAVPAILFVVTAGLLSVRYLPV